MVLEETLKHQFETLGINVDDKAVLAKCLDLCDLYNVSEEVLVAVWVAFVVEKNLDMEPTVDMLGQIERSILKTKKDSLLDTLTKSKTSTPTVQKPRISRQYADEEEDLVGMYGIQCLIPPPEAEGQKSEEITSLIKAQATSQAKRLRSPDSADVSITRENKIRALETSVSAANSSKEYEIPRRIVSSESGELRCKCGRDVLDWKTTNKMEVRIGRTIDLQVDSQPTYMFEILSKKVSNLHTVCREFGARLCSVWRHITGEGSPATTSNVRNQAQTSFRTWGRILSGDGERLTTKTVMLEGCRASDRFDESGTIELDLSNVDSYSIFPGQIIAVEGTNPTGTTLMAQKLFTSRHIPPAPMPKLEENLHVVVAAGPFTDRENLDFQPLFRLMDSIVETEPHVLILLGPFVPVQHKAIQDATILETFQELFERIIEKVMKYTKGKCTQVVLIPSSQDAHHDPIYPTPEFFLPKSMRSPNLHLMTDPCILDIEGLTIGTTSVDIIRHLVKEEIGRNVTRMGRLSRMMQHVLYQGCFYPLYPPSNDVNIDTALWGQCAMMYQRPHILIIPSEMQYFVKWDDDCLFINPGILNKDSYARMIIRPSFDSTWSLDNVDCEILKI